MGTTDSPPFTAQNAQTTGSNTAGADGKAAAVISTDGAIEKNGRESTGSATDLRRPSDLSCPGSAHNNPFDTDVEAMITHTTSEGNNAGRKSIACRGLGDSQVWPGQSHWRKKAKEQKIQRSCTCLSRLSKRNRLIAKVLIGLLVIGIAVGVGVGISKPLGAPIWGQHNS